MKSATLVAGDAFSVATFKLGEGGRREFLNALETPEVASLIATCMAKAGVDIRNFYPQVYPGGGYTVLLVHLSSHSLLETWPERGLIRAVHCPGIYQEVENRTEKIESGARELFGAGAVGNDTICSTNAFAELEYSGKLLEPVALQDSLESLVINARLTYLGSTIFHLENSVLVVAFLGESHVAVEVNYVSGAVKIWACTCGNHRESTIRLRDAIVEMFKPIHRRLSASFTGGAYALTGQI